MTPSGKLPSGAAFKDAEREREARKFSMTNVRRNQRALAEAEAREAAEAKANQERLRREMYERRAA